MAKDKMGDGPNKDDLLSPLSVGPKKGQEGWTPSNPTLPISRDPLGYCKQAESGGRD